MYGRLVLILIVIATLMGAFIPIFHKRIQSAAWLKVSKPALLPMGAMPILNAQIITLLFTFYCTEVHLAFCKDTNETVDMFKV